MDGIIVLKNLEKSILFSGPCVRSFVNGIMMQQTNVGPIISLAKSIYLICRQTIIINWVIESESLEKQYQVD